MALTFLSPWRGRTRSGLSWSSGIIRLMANFWLNSKKVEGAGVGQTDRAPGISKLRALGRDRQTEQSIGKWKLRGWTNRPQGKHSKHRPLDRETRHQTSS